MATACFLQAQATESDHTGKHDVDLDRLSTSGWAQRTSCASTLAAQFAWSGSSSASDCRLFL